MSFEELPLGWIAGTAAVVALTIYLLMRRPEGGSRHRSRSDNGYGSGSGSGSGSGAVMPHLPEQKALLTAANQLREGLEKQARQMEELRTFWAKRMDDMDRRIAELARVQPQGRESVAAQRSSQDYGGGYAEPYDSGMYGAESLGRGGLPALEPAWSPGPGDQPVEIREGVLVVSRSLPPAGYVSASGSGQGRVYLNADVPLTEFSLPKWAAFFDLQGARPYAAYRTRRPAEVRWDEGAGRGELISKGTAEAI